MSLHPEEDFTPRDAVSVSPAALAFAREFAESLGSVHGGSQIVSFDWAMSVVVIAPDRSELDCGSCLTIGAYRRDEVPIDARRYMDGLEFTVKIPTSVWSQASEKIIDRDDTLYFKLALR